MPFSRYNNVFHTDCQTSSLFLLTTPIKPADFNSRPPVGLLTKPRLTFSLYITSLTIHPSFQLFHLYVKTPGIVGGRFADIEDVRLPGEIAGDADTKYINRGGQLELDM